MVQKLSCCQIEVSAENYHPGLTYIPHYAKIVIYWDTKYKTVWKLIFLYNILLPQVRYMVFHLVVYYAIIG